MSQSNKQKLTSFETDQLSNIDDSTISKAQWAVLSTIAATSGDISADSLILDSTGTEALLVRKNGDTGDVFTVDTTNSIVKITGSQTINGSLTSTLATGTAPFTVASTTNVANLNASTLNGNTFPIPGTIGSTTPNTGAFTTLSASGAITSTLATGTAPFTVASTTNVANLNASTLNGNTFPIPGTIGSTTPNTGAFTTIDASGIITSTNTTTSTSNSTGALKLAGGLGISNTTDATSNINGGAFTVAGGAGIAKKAYFGSTLQIADTLTLSGVNSSAASTVGKIMSVAGAYTDTSTAISGTATYAIMNKIGAATIAATNSSVTTTNAISLYIVGGPVASTNQTITNSYAFQVGSGTSKFDGAIEMTNGLTGSSTTASTSNSTGSVKLLGGVGIANTTDASSATNGGSFTTAGGMGVEKKLYVGTNLYIAGSEVFSEPSGTIRKTTFAASNNIVTPTDITGLTFDSTVISSLGLVIEDKLNATTPGYKARTYLLNYNYTTAAWDFDAVATSGTGGTTSDLTVATTAGVGRIRYATPNHTGFVSLTLKFKTIFVLTV